MWQVVTHCTQIDPNRDKGSSLAYPAMAAELFRRIGDANADRELIPYLVQTSVLLEGDSLSSLPLAFYLLYRYRVNWKDLNTNEGEEEEREARRGVGMATDKAFTCQLTADAAFEVTLFSHSHIFHRLHTYSSLSHTSFTHITHSSLSLTTDTHAHRRRWSWRRHSRR